MSQFAWDSLGLCLFFQYLLMAYSHSQECPNRITDSVVWLTQPPVTPIESCLSLIYLLHVGMHGDLPLANRIWQWWQDSHSLDYLRLQRERFSCGSWRMSCLLPMVRATGTVARNTGQPLGVEGLHLPDARNWILLAFGKLQKGNCWLLDCSLWDPEQRPQLSCACTPDPRTPWGIKWVLV